MKLHRPSPSLVVSIVALVVACTGTATAAGVLIRNSSQVKASSLNGSDIKNGSLHGSDLANGTLTAKQLDRSAVNQLAAGLRTTPGGGGTAQEAFRKSGPEDQGPGQHLVATLPQLAPGTYLLLGKSTISPVSPVLGLGELLRQSKTSDAQCILGAGGDEDRARSGVTSPGSQSPASVNMQITRTIDKPTDVTITCDVNDIGWRASDTSIIALKLASSNRAAVGG